MSDPSEVPGAASPAGPSRPNRDPGPAETSSSVADGRPRRLDPRSIQLQRIEGVLATAALSFAGVIGVMILLLSTSSSRARAAALLGAWLVLTVAAVCLALVWPPMRYRRVSYRLDERGLQIRSGVLWRSIVDVPRSRVQHTDVQQGPIERGFDLATLLIHTAGTQHAVIPLSGLEHGVALRIRDSLLADDAADG